jgi:S1-C subfamily serine protease
MDKETDVAVLLVQPVSKRRFPTLPLGSTRHVGLADWVLVIGSPFGLSQSVSVGVVSAVARPEIMPGGKNTPLDYLQTDAAMNPGSSGGPVLDLEGHVVAIANSVNVAGQGIGFAVPVDLAKSVLPELIRFGHVRRGWMGVSVEDGDRPGAKVTSVVQGGPAHRAGLLVGDIIVRFGKHRLARALDLRRLALSMAVGNPIQLEVQRAGAAMTLSLQPTSAPRGVTLHAVSRDAVWGANVTAVDSTAAQEAGLARPFGALIQSVRAGSVLAQAGLASGDVVLKVNRQEVLDQLQFMDAVGQLGSGDVARLFVRRGHRTVALSFLAP